MHYLADAEFWVAVAFLMFVGLLGWMGAHRMINVALDRRAARIKTELDEARRVRDEAEALLAEYKRKRGEADREAEAIVTAARRAGQRPRPAGTNQGDELVRR